MGLTVRCRWRRWPIVQQDLGHQPYLWLWLRQRVCLCRSAPRLPPPRKPGSQRPHGLRLQAAVLEGKDLRVGQAAAMVAAQSRRMLGIMSSAFRAIQLPFGC